MLLAEENLYLTVAGILSTIDISPALDEKQPSKLEFKQGAIRFDIMRSSLSYDHPF